MDILPIGIVGSRRRKSLTDRQMVLRLVEWLKDRYSGRSRLVLVSGGCPEGADHFMEEAARIHGVETDIHPINKEGIKNKWDFTQRAFARNKIIAERSRVLFCLVSPDRTGGTENTILHGLELRRTIFLVMESGDVYLLKDGNPTCDAVVNLLDLKSIA